jgi:hypothetical protein
VLGLGFQPAVPVLHELTLVGYCGNHVSKA